MGNIDASDVTTVYFDSRHKELCTDYICTECGKTFWHTFYANTQGSFRIVSLPQTMGRFDGVCHACGVPYTVENLEFWYLSDLQSFGKKVHVVRPVDFHCPNCRSKFDTLQIYCTELIDFNQVIGKEG